MFRFQFSSHLLTVRASLAVASFMAARPAVADTILMNLDPVGTTSNQNLYGTVLTDGSATWPAASAYRDYQFELVTPSGSATFDNFGLQLSAQLRNSTANDNTLRATLWAGPIVMNPLLSNSLLTVTTPNSSFVNGSSGFSSVQLGVGTLLAPQTITTTPSIFFFRVWAEGGNSNAGFQTKMAGTLGEFQSITMNPDQAIDGYIDFDTNGDGIIDPSERSSTIDPIAEVPEPSAIVLAAVGTGLAACRLLRRRRG